MKITTDLQKNYDVIRAINVLVSYEIIDIKMKDDLIKKLK